MKLKLTCSLLLALLLGSAQAGEPEEAAPQALSCPAGWAEGIRCLGGRDSAGADYLIALPKGWKSEQGTLVLHSHGGPFLGAPSRKRVEEDLERWSIVPRAGYAWAGSSYRQGGVAVRSAAEDTERLRRIFVRYLGQPAMTILHGQSWGASVAAQGAEMFAAGKPYDGVLLSSGVLAGGTKAYDFRLDLRVVYQDLCHNHPRPDEPQYPLWQGLPAGSTMKAAELARRVNECLALDKPAAERTAEQAQRIATIVKVIRIPERSIQSHMSWATFHFQDIVEKRSGGGNVFGNIGARYAGSDDDAGLNKRVLRYAADPAAVARFGADTDLHGGISVPVLTVHAIHDPTAFVEMDHSFAQTMTLAGHADTLVQTFTEDREHSYLSDASYVALLQALQAWMREGRKPTAAGVAEACVAAEKRFPSTCRFNPLYKPAPLDTRVTPRDPP